MELIINDSLRQHLIAKLIDTITTDSVYIILSNISNQNNSKLAVLPSKDTMVVAQRLDTLSGYDMLSYAIKVSDAISTPMSSKKIFIDGIEYYVTKDIAVSKLHSFNALYISATVENEVDTTFIYNTASIVIKPFETTPVQVTEEGFPSITISTDHTLVSQYTFAQETINIHESKTFNILLPLVKD